MRDDLALAEKAVEMGFSVINNGNSKRCQSKPYSPEQATPAEALSFEIGNVVVWHTASGWRFAELIDKNYRNHSEFSDSLLSCLWDAKKHKQAKPQV